LKKQSIKQLKNKAWEIFSEYIRKRDKGICFTCGIRKDWKQMQAGHFIHGKSFATYFDERNVNCQCVGCNLYKSGARDEYAIKLEEKYGYGILQELKQLKNIKFRFTRDYLEEIINVYINKIKELDNE